ncbi:MAG TPA: PQQ-binding-like beta-propeller repeat protein [Terriglobales bacterium]|jgi:outer membrane protein assembly factor BamB
MKSKLTLALVLFLLLVTTVAVAQPNITTLSDTTLTRSGRLLINGTGFGVAQGSARVEIAGISAPITRWADQLISAYVPETAPTGQDTVQVFNANGNASNTVSLDVTLRPGPQGHLNWRFKADADYVYARPAVGADGTVYAIDIGGHLYAIKPNGGLKWVFNATGYGFGNVSVGDDGTIYTGGSTAIFAIRPNGTLKWQYDQNPAAFILLGPNVGPDGNIYAVAAQGLGVFSLTPQGNLRWSVPEAYDRPIVILQEVAFGPLAQSRLYFHANGHIRGLQLDGTPVFVRAEFISTSQGDPQPVTGPDGTLYTNTFSATGSGLALTAFNNSGVPMWSTFDDFQTPTSVLGSPDVGPDGVIYDSVNLNEFYAVNPDGSIKGKRKDNGILQTMIASPLNDLVLIGGIVNYGQPGFVEAISTAGAPLWRMMLPQENGGRVTPFSRARFVPDGKTAYIGTSIPGEAAENAYSYVYSIRIK